MSFQTEIYPYRNNRSEFPRRLLRKVDTEFTQIVSIPNYPRRESGRCHWNFNHGTVFEEVTGTGRVVNICDYSATLTDKVVIKALLKGWLRDISDRYLDLGAVNRFERSGGFNSLDDAYQTIRQNSPAGAVKFLYNELPRNSNNLILFGNSLPANMDYNRYFTTLLAWDTLHCFGLVLKLSRLKNLLEAAGGGNSVHVALQSAAIWISRNQRNDSGNIYRTVVSIN